MLLHTWLHCDFILLYTLLYYILSLKKVASYLAVGEFGN